MAYVHADVLRDGLNVIKNSATKMYLISAHTASDSLATVVGNKIAEVDMVSADFTIAPAGSNLALSVAAGKTAIATAPASGTTGLYVAFTDSTRVLWVTQASTDVQAASGATVTFPAVTYTSNQPV